MGNPATSDAVKPVEGGFAITAGAGALSHVTRGIYVGVTGNITCTMYPTGDSVQFIGIAAGVIHPICCDHVTAATATSIVGLY